VVMESIGVYWIQVWNLLEDGFDLLLVKPQHFRAVPGRKTDQPCAQSNRKTLEPEAFFGSNRHLRGYWENHSLVALLRGNADSESLAECAKGTLRGKRAELMQALQGQMTDHQRIMLQE
jgi:hypothetical protein